MHFWYVNPLARKLGKGLVTESQGALYFLASTILILLQEHYSLWFGPRSGWLFHFELVALVLIALVGVSQAWKANGGRQFVLSQHYS
jgi:hypothetical protein